MTNWIHRDEDMKKIMARHNDPSNEAQSVANTKAELIPHLKRTTCWHGLPNYVIAKMENAATFHTFNQALNMVYDYADDNKIWTGFMPD